MTESYRRTPNRRERRQQRDALGRRRMVFDAPFGHPGAGLVVGADMGLIADTAPSGSSPRPGTKPRPLPLTLEC